MFTPVSKPRITSYRKRCNVWWVASVAACLTVLTSTLGESSSSNTVLDNIRCDGTHPPFEKDSLLLRKRGI